MTVETRQLKLEDGRVVLLPTESEIEHYRTNLRKWTEEATEKGVQGDVPEDVRSAWDSEKKADYERLSSLIKDTQAILDYMIGVVLEGEKQGARVIEYKIVNPTNLQVAKTEQEATGWDEQAQQQTYSFSLHQHYLSRLCIAGMSPSEVDSLPPLVGKLLREKVWMAAFPTTDEMRFFREPGGVTTTG